MTAVLTDVVERSQFAAFVSGGKYALSFDLGGNITSGLSKVFLMTQKQPAFVENLLALEIKKMPMLVTVGMQRVRA